MKVPYWRPRLQQGLPHRVALPISYQDPAYSPEFHRLRHSSCYRQLSTIIQSGTQGGELRWRQWLTFEAIARVAWIPVLSSLLMHSLAGHRNSGGPSGAEPTPMVVACAIPTPTGEATASLSVTRSTIVTATTSSTRTFGCPPAPCPRNLDFAVNGCTCNGQIYVDSEVNPSYCCTSGFSGPVCAESLVEVAVMKATFGTTPSEVEAQLVSISFQGRSIKVHQKAEAAFKAVNERLKSINYEIVEPIESYDLRDVADSGIPSTHAFGIAVDINPSTNPSCGVTRNCRCFNDLITDMPPEFVQAFKDEGFEWGGDWLDHPDPMHFEWHGWQTTAGTVPPEGRTVDYV